MEAVNKVHIPSQLIKTTESSKKFIADCLTAFCSLLLCSFIFYGNRILLNALVSVFSAYFVDFLFTAIRRKNFNPKSLGAVCRSLCLLCLLPGDISFLIIIIGSVICTGIQHLFGFLYEGENKIGLFSPVAVSYSFLIIAFPKSTSLFPMYGEKLPLFSSYTGEKHLGIQWYIQKYEASPYISVSDIMEGKFVGGQGSTYVLLLLIISACMLIHGSLSISCFLPSLTIYTSLLSIFPPKGEPDILASLFCGTYFFAMMFIVCDPLIMPKRRFLRFIYGSCIAIFAYFFRINSVSGGWFCLSLLVSICVAQKAAEYADIYTKNYIKKSASRIIGTDKTAISYERLKRAARSGAIKQDLSQTIELDFVNMRVNTPKIEGKVTKLHRSDEHRLSLLLISITRQIKEFIRRIDAERKSSPEFETVIVPRPEKISDIANALKRSIVYEKADEKPLYKPKPEIIFADEIENDSIDIQDFEYLEDGYIMNEFPEFDFDIIDEVKTTDIKEISPPVSPSSVKITKYLKDFTIDLVNDNNKNIWE